MSLQMSLFHVFFLMAEEYPEFSPFFTHTALLCCVHEGTSLTLSYNLLLLPIPSLYLHVPWCQKAHLTYVWVLPTSHFSRVWHTTDVHYTLDEGMKSSFWVQDVCLHPEHVRKKGSQEARGKEGGEERKRKVCPMTHLIEHHFQENEKWLKEKAWEGRENL